MHRRSTALLVAAALATSGCGSYTYLRLEDRRPVTAVLAGAGIILAEIVAGIAIGEAVDPSTETEPSVLAGTFAMVGGVDLLVLLIIGISMSDAASK